MAQSAHLIWTHQVYRVEKDPTTVLPDSPEDNSLPAFAPQNRDLTLSPPHKPSRPAGSALTPELGALRKAVEAVLIRPTEGKVTLLSRRFFNVLVAHAQTHPVSDDEEYHSMALSQLMANARYHSRNMEYLTEVLNQLMSTVVNWGDSPKNLKGPKYRWSGAPLVAFARIESTERGRAILRFDFHKEIKKLLLNPQVYARVSLEMNARMSTHASLALYELGERYLTNKGGLTMKKPWKDWVVPLTGNPDISPDLEYKYFARDVLKKALREVNDAQAEFEMSYQVERAGKRVESLQFVVTRKTSPSVVSARDTEIQVEHLTLVGRMLKYRISQSVAEQYLRGYGASRVTAALLALDLRMDNLRQEPIKNPQGYFKKLLDEGDLPDPASKRQDSSPVMTGATLSYTLKQQYSQAMRERARAIWLEAGPDQQEEMLAQFEVEALSSLPEPIKKSWAKFRAQGRERRLSGLVEIPFLNWLAAPYLQADADTVLNWAVHSGVIRVQG